MDVSRYAAIPFAEKGRDMTGCDCWGIVYLVYRDLLGIELPLYTEKYQNTEDEKVLAAAINGEKVKWEEVETPEAGNVVLMRLKGQPMHVGVFIGGGMFIHCLSGSGTVIERVNSITWRNRIVGYYRFTR